MEIISHFIYSNKLFIIILNNNNLIYCIRENNINRYKISPKEQYIFNQVINSITPNPKESFFTNLKEYKGTFYKLFFNPAKNLYYTDSSDSKIISLVNLNYNHVPTLNYLYTNEENKESQTEPSKNQFFKRAIKIGKKIIFISVLIGLSLSILTECSNLAKTNSDNLVLFTNTQPQSTTEYDPIYNGGIIIDIEQEKQNYNFSMIEEALKNNQNLTKEEKEFIKNLKFVFDENHDYMDIEMIIERLKTLTINYNSDSNGSTGGTYNNEKNIITLYESTDFQNCSVFSFTHEFMHVLQKPSNDFLKELSNEFFSREVVRKLYDNGIINEKRLNSESQSYTIVPIFGIGYNDYMPTYYVLAELLDEETLRKYQFGCDTNTILKGISYSDKGIINQEKARNLIVDINSARIYNKETHSFDLVSNFETTQILSNCYNDLNYYYKLKKGYEIKDNLKIAINYFNTPTLGLFITDTFTPYTIEDEKILEKLLLEASKTEGNTIVGYYKICTPRTYFSNDHENPTFSFNSNKSTPTIEITDELAKKFKDNIKNNEIIKASNTKSYTE